MFDAVIRADMHLGSSNCQVRNLQDFLQGFVDERVATAKLILNGDVFDSIDFRRLNKHHWKVLALLRKLSDRMEIIWICGNHDSSAEVISHLLGVTVKEEYVLHSGGQTILVLPGHTFDDFIDAHPVLTGLGDGVYFILQRLDRSHYFAKLAKKGSKTFLRCAMKIQEGAVEHRRRRGCSQVCCGHTHPAVVAAFGPVLYYNSGCWTDVPCTYLCVADGCVRLQAYEPAMAEHDAEHPADLALAS